MKHTTSKKTRPHRLLRVLLLLTGVVMLWWMWSASPETVYRILRYNISSIDDYRIFPSRPLRAGQEPFRFLEQTGESYIPEYIPVKGRGIRLQELLESNNTTAFLIIRNDTILFERYYSGTSQASPSLSFSMTKSFLSILIGCAIDDGIIQSVDQPVTDFVPELAANGFDRVTIRHLLQMTSGMEYAENDNPFGIHPRFYYTTQLEDEILQLELKEEPGLRWQYRSGDNALLGLVLSRALGDVSITDYMQQRLWGPLGMEYDGYWSTDHSGGLEKTWCCLSATARDYAKFGRLYMDGGDWNGTRILSPEWVTQSTLTDTSAGSAWNHQYQWWLVSKDSRAFMAVGHLGQYLYVDPDADVIIVRLGRSEGRLSREDWIDALTYLALNVR